MRKVFFVFVCMGLTLLVVGCNSTVPNDRLNVSGDSLMKRIKAPDGYTWIVEDENSFGRFIQNIAVKPHGSKILDYSGAPIYNQSEHIAIMDYDVGTKDLQQCADAVIRVRAEYLWAAQKQDEIGFHFTSGDYFTWNQYKEGYRPVVTNNNKVSFLLKAAPDDSYAGFRKYLDIVYMYAGTISLNKETKPISHDGEINVGDILITPGSPGHVVFVCGRAKDKDGDMIYLLAEGYTPAQSIHVITNPYNGAIDPWYRLSTDERVVITARYTFAKNNIRTFR